MLDLNMKILIVDDQQTMRVIVKNVLKDLGFNNFKEAENGQQAYNLLQKGGFDFVISDWNMPVMDGLTLVQQIRRNASFNGIPVLMLSAEKENDKILAAVKAGVNNYILKPFTPESLEEKINIIFA